MKLITVCTDILEQLAGLVRDMDEHDYAKPSTSLSGSSVGQHLRHTLEFFLCLESGFSSGTINYDKRNHDKVIESDKSIALSTIHRIIDFVRDIDMNKDLKLELNYDISSDQSEVLQTTSARELVYNIEHAVHHMAIMKIGVREVAPYITLRKDFGVAASTIRYKESGVVVGQ